MSNRLKPEAFKSAQPVPQYKSLDECMIKSLAGWCKTMRERGTVISDVTKWCGDRFDPQGALNRTVIDLGIPAIQADGTPFSFCLRDRQLYTFNKLMAVTVAAMLVQATEEEGDADEDNVRCMSMMASLQAATEYSGFMIWRMCAIFGPEDPSELSESEELCYHCVYGAMFKTDGEVQEGPQHAPVFAFPIMADSMKLMIQYGVMDYFGDID